MQAETPTQHKTHRKGDSIHRRKTYELNNASGFDDIHSEADALEDMIRSKSNHLSPEVPNQNQFSNHNRHENDSYAFNDREMDLHVGMQVKIRDVPGLALIWWMDGDMIGVELESSYGDCDGEYKGDRKFLVSPNCATFIAKERVDRVYRNLEAPRFRPRADFNMGDVAMISSKVGVGVVRYASTELIGCQLNEATGNSDGSYRGHRFFKTKHNHAIFISPRDCKKIAAENLLEKLNETVVRLQELEQGLKKTTGVNIR